MQKSRYGVVVQKFMPIVLKLLITVVVVISAVGGFLYLKSTKPKVVQKNVAEKVWPVKAVDVRFATHRPVLQLYGEILAGRKVQLRSLVAGKIIKTSDNLRNGAAINAGEVLLRIDPFNYEGAVIEARARLKEAESKLDEIYATIALENAVLKQAQTQLDLAELDLERAETLVRKSTVSKKIADDRKLIVSQRRQSAEQHFNNLKVYNARASQQKAVIDRLKWSLRKSERQLADASLKAPFSAYVSDVNVEIGQVVGANDRVATLLDKSWLEVKFTISDNQYGRITDSEGTVIGKQITIQWNVGGNPLLYKATIERVGAEISASSGGVEVYARVKNKTEDKDAPLRSGAFVEVMMPDREYENVASLPQTAIFGKDTVFIIRDGRLSERKVELVGASDQIILVRGDLQEGEKVLVSKLSKVGEGLRVKTY
jgi:RND family efflux transporter MFP subunit